MKKMLVLALAVSAAALVSSCAVWRPCASTTPPVTPSYCAPVLVPCVPMAPVKRTPPPPTKCK